MISFRDVSYSYPNSGKNILRQTSFEIAKGDFAVILGATGAGKSTILHLLTGQTTPASGEIRIGPYELSAMKRREIPGYRRTIGCVFQDFKLLEEKTVAENISFALELQRKYTFSAIAKKTVEIMERVGIANDGPQFPRAFSAGSRQRAAIARALVTEPLVLFADGATAWLDPETASGIFELLASENIRGMTILLTATSEQFFPVFPKRAKYFELRDGVVQNFLPVS